MKRSALLLTVLFFTACASFDTSGQYGLTSLPYGTNSVSFINHSGEDALVKLVCPNGAEKMVEVMNKNTSTIRDLGRGTYFIKICYSQGSSSRYCKGEDFSITATYPSYETVSITLHGVVNGNYSTYPISGSEF